MRPVGVLILNAGMSVGLYIGLFIAVLLIAACGQPEIQSLRVQAAPWAHGERSTYEVIDINQNFAGTATIEFTTGATQIAEEAWTMRREVAA